MTKKKKLARHPSILLFAQRTLRLSFVVPIVVEKHEYDECGGTLKRAYTAHLNLQADDKPTIFLVHHLSDHPASTTYSPHFLRWEDTRARARAAKDLISGTPSLIAPKHPANDGNEPRRKAEGKG